MKRRDLLKSAVAAAAAPYVITSAALGNDKVPSASERVTLGHIGVGHWTKVVAGGRGEAILTCALESPNRKFQSVAVADCYEENRTRVAKQIGGKAYQDFRDVLARPDIDGVIIATPDHWHVPIAIMAANAGKHCYVEKPLGISLEQDLACKKVFREKKRIFQYGTQQRESAHTNFGRELVRSGKLGKLKAIEVKAPDGGAGGSTAEAPVPEGFDYEMWLGPAPQKPYTVDRCHPQGTYWIYDQSIGYLGGWGAHPLDIMVWCYDGDQAGPYTVEGAGTVPSEGLFDVVYNWNMTMHMADGVKVTFTPADNSTKFIGAEGRLEITRGTIRAYPANLLPHPFPKQSDIDDAASHVHSFVAAILANQDPPSTIEDAVRSDTISHLCDIAVRTGRKITWDPKALTIVGDEEAKKMMSRPMRAPWKLEV